MLPQTRTIHIIIADLRLFDIGFLLCLVRPVAVAELRQLRRHARWRRGRADAWAYCWRTRQPVNGLAKADGRLDVAYQGDIVAHVVAVQVARDIMAVMVNGDAIVLVFTESDA